MLWLCALEEPWDSDSHMILRSVIYIFHLSFKFTGTVVYFLLKKNILVEHVIPELTAQTPLEKAATAFWYSYFAICCCSRLLLRFLPPEFYGGIFLQPLFLSIPCGYSCCRSVIDFWPVALILLSTAAVSPRLREPGPA